MKKWILFLFFLWLFWGLFLLWKNHQMPLWYDHGAYKEFIESITNGKDYYSLRPYLQWQFEPFSSAFLYYIGTAMPARYILTWFYAIIYLGIALWFLFIGKRKNKYTPSSYVGLGLVFFSVILYKVMWWWFGKELIATFLLLWAIRHHRKIFIAGIFMAACIALHRLTGFIGLLYLTSLFIQKSNWKKYAWLLFFSTIFGGMTYFWTWGKHVTPFLSTKLTTYMFYSGSYGTLFTEWRFWAFESFALLCVFFGLISAWIKKKNIILNKSHWVLFWVIALMVVLRCIAHTRMEAFFDLTLILLSSQILPQIFSKKTLVYIVWIQALLWGSHLNFYHTPGITEPELKNIEAIQKYIPKNSKIFALNAVYMPWLQWYSGIEILAPYIAGYTKNNWTSLSYIMQSKKELCGFLKKMPKNTYLFVWEKERFYPAIEENNCLNEVIYINKKSRVFTLNTDYREESPPQQLQQSQNVKCSR